MTYITMDDLKDEDRQAVEALAKATKLNKDRIEAWLTVKLTVLDLIDKPLTPLARLLILRDELKAYKPKENTDGNHDQSSTP